MLSKNEVGEGNLGVSFSRPVYHSRHFPIGQLRFGITG